MILYAGLLNVYLEWESGFVGYLLRMAASKGIHFINHSLVA